MGKFFVYGTLKKGGRFSRVWPDGAKCKKATVKGSLYNMGWFPTIRLAREGEACDTVDGEVWEVPDDEHIHVLRELDRIEGYREDRPQDSLFLRKEVSVTTDDGDEVATVYEMRNPPEYESPKRIMPNDSGLVSFDCTQR